MKKIIVASLLALGALAIAPTANATVEKTPPAPASKAIATAPPTATRFILATADTKAKAAKKAKKKAVKKEAKVKKTGTGFKLKPTAPVMV